MFGNQNETLLLRSTLFDSYNFLTYFVPLYLIVTITWDIKITIYVFPNDKPSFKNTTHETKTKEAKMHKLMMFLHIEITAIQHRNQSRPI